VEARLKELLRGEYEKSGKAFPEWMRRGRRQKK
jgi:hypothetical protein